MTSEPYSQLGISTPPTVSCGFPFISLVVGCLSSWISGVGLGSVVVLMWPWADIGTTSPWAAILARISSSFLSALVTIWEGILWDHGRSLTAAGSLKESVPCECQKGSSPPSESQVWSPYPSPTPTRNYSVYWNITIGELCGRSSPTRREAEPPRTRFVWGSRWECNYQKPYAV